MNNSFNARQREAIDHNLGPLLVVAGAGTGKTAILVERISRLIAERTAQPEEILAVTYTREAARNLQQRIANRLAALGIFSVPEVNTFHAYCDGLLRRHNRSFALLGNEDLWIYLRQNIQQLTLKHFIVARNPGQFLYDLLAFMDRCHDELVGPGRYQKFVADMRAGAVAPQRTIRSSKLDELDPEEHIARCEEIACVFAKVEEILREKNWGTFGMQIAEAARLLQDDKNVLQKEQGRAKFILIDEFQDVNAAQIQISELLSGADRNVFAVGDPDQAIYRFRGASSAAFDEFLRRFPESKGVVLNENYRSLTPVLAGAFSAIRENPEIGVPAGRGLRFQRTQLIAVRDRDGERDLFTGIKNPVEVVVASSHQEEAADIAATIQRLSLTYRKVKKQAFPSPAFAVLYRSHKHRDRVIEELSALRIPFVVKGIDAFDSREVRDLLALLRVVHNPADSLSLFRVAAFPRFAIDPAAVRLGIDKTGGGTLRSVLPGIPGGERVLSEIDAATAAVTGCSKASDVLQILISQFQVDPESEFVRALVDFVKAWESKPTTQSGQVTEFLDYIYYFREANCSLCLAEKLEGESDPLAVRLMSVHGAKGLEFRHVFIPRVQTGAFPVGYREPLFEFPSELRSTVAQEGGSALHQEEERRLFYVGMTRAQDTLAIYARAGRGKDRSPAGFVRPLLKDKMLKGFLMDRGIAPAGDKNTPAATPWSGATGVGSWLLLPPREKLQRRALSAGAIETYELCPLRFKLERDWNLPGEISAALQYGNAVHTVLKQFYDPTYEESIRSVEQVQSAFSAEFSKAALDDSVQRSLYFRLGGEQLGEFVRQSHVRPVPNIVGAEIPFELEIQGVKVVGRIDRVDLLEGQKVAIVDYKTGRARKQQEADRSLQLSIYAIAASEAMQYIPQRLEFYNLETNESVVTTRSPEQMVTARERVIKVADAVQQQLFEPNPDHHCTWCPFQKLCPAIEQQAHPQANEPETNFSRLSTSQRRVN